MNSSKNLQYLLVFLQLACFGYFVFYESIFSFEIPGIIFRIAGLALGVWAVLVQGIGNFDIIPKPRENGKLITKGPYRTVRHPMYLALIIFFFPVFFQPIFKSILIFSILLLVLIIKMEMEERMLKEKFARYSEYSKTSWKLIPYIY